jgi:hypothetical protein
MAPKLSRPANPSLFDLQLSAVSLCRVELTAALRSGTPRAGHRSPIESGSRRALVTSSITQRSAQV